MTTPQPRQMWQHGTVTYRVLTITQPEPPPDDVLNRGFSMPVLEWGSETQRDLYREITPPDQKLPRPWAGKTSEESATTWLEGGGVYVVIGVPGLEVVWYAVPLGVLLEEFIPLQAC